MAFRDFWINVRTAARLPVPPSTVDSPRFDAQTVEAILRTNSHWLTPDAVGGFDQNDVAYLADARRTSLAKLVRDFLDLTRSVRPTAATPGALEEALVLFRDVVLVLEFDRFGDPEAFRLGHMIEAEIAQDRQQELAELRFNTGTDHTGDPGLWIWAFLSAEASEDDERFLETAEKLRGLIDAIARRVAPERFPYLSFRSIVEQTEPVEA
jgi:hypothetical protein